MVGDYCSPYVPAAPGPWGQELGLPHSPRGVEPLPPAQAAAGLGVPCPPTTLPSNCCRETWQNGGSGGLKTLVSLAAPLWGQALSIPQTGDRAVMWGECSPMGWAGGCHPAGGHAVVRGSGLAELLPSGCGQGGPRVPMVVASPRGLCSCGGPRGDESLLLWGPCCCEGPAVLGAPASPWLWGL